MTNEYSENVPIRFMTVMKMTKTLSGIMSSLFLKNAKSNRIFEATLRRNKTHITMPSK